MPSSGIRDRWLDLCHALPPFRGRLAVARLVAKHLLTNRHNLVAWATLPNGLRLKVDLRWQGGYDVLYYFRTYEESLTALMRRALDVREGVLIDVGANIGAFCLLSADVLRRQGGRAYAIEPLPQNIAFLNESIDVNGLADLIEVLPVAVGDRDGSLVVGELRSGEIANARPVSWAGETTSMTVTTTVPMTTLDGLVKGRSIRNVQFLKLDIEGAELFALRGSKEVLAEQRPLVYAEFHREYMTANGTTIDEIREFVQEADYDLRYLSADGSVTTAPPPEQSRFLDVVLVPHRPTAYQLAVLGR